MTNVRVAAEGRDGDVTSLRTVEDGQTDRSDGIGLSNGVAEQGSATHQTESGDVADRNATRPGDAAAEEHTRERTMDPEMEQTLDELESTDVNQTSPLEAVRRVQECRERLGGDAR